MDLIDIEDDADLQRAIEESLCDRCVCDLSDHNLSDLYTLIIGNASVNSGVLYLLCSSKSIYTTLSCSHIREIDVLKDSVGYTLSDVLQEHVATNVHVTKFKD